MVVETWRPERTARYCEALTRRVADAARQLGLVVPPNHAPHIVGLRVPPFPATPSMSTTSTPSMSTASAPSSGVEAVLAVARGLRSDGVIVSVRSGAIRVSVVGLVEPRGFHCSPPPYLLYRDAARTFWEALLGSETLTK